MNNDFGYTIAGAGTFINTILRKNKEFHEYDANKILELLNINALVSFGENITKKNKRNQEYGKKYIDRFRKGNKTLIESRSKLKQFVLDSGGYQCAIGLIPMDRIYEWIDTYYDYLNDYNDDFDSAFSLDLPPNSESFDSYEQIYEINRDSYKKIFSLPEEKRKKIIFVYHFRTPKIFETWEKLLHDDDIIGNFNSRKWAIGGIVTGLAGEGSIPFITITIPITRIIDFELKRGNKKFSIHILGGCGYRDILFYEMIKVIARELWGAKITFTYDSSGVFRLVMQGRKVDYFDSNGYVKHFSVKSSSANIKDTEYLLTVFNKMLVETRQYFKFNDSNLYQSSNGKFKDNIIPMLLMIYPYFMNKLQEDAKNFAEENIKYLLGEQEDIFLHKITTKLAAYSSSGKITNRFRRKTSSILSGLHFLKNRNLDNIKRIIYDNLSKDEIIFNKSDNPYGSF